jgi:hypothetical protein
LRGVLADRVRAAALPPADGPDPWPVFAGRRPTRGRRPRPGPGHRAGPAVVLAGRRAVPGEDRMDAGPAAPLGLHLAEQNLSLPLLLATSRHASLRSRQRSTRPGAGSVAAMAPSATRWADAASAGSSTRADARLQPDQERPVVMAGNLVGFRSIGRFWRNHAAGRRRLRQAGQRHLLAADRRCESWTRTSLQPSQGHLFRSGIANMSAHDRALTCTFGGVTGPSPSVELGVRRRPLPYGRRDTS